MRPRSALSSVRFLPWPGSLGEVLEVDVFTIIRTHRGEACQAPPPPAAKEMGVLDPA